MAAEIHLTFAADWKAQILAAAPMIAPARQYTYPRAVAGEEEALARGAMYAIVKPANGGDFLATCARGFSDPDLPSGAWSCPRTQDVCLVSGGYASIVDTAKPEAAFMIPLRPVAGIFASIETNLLVFAGFHHVVAYGADGLAWESKRLTWEGLTELRLDGETLRGKGWDMMADEEVPFVLDLKTGSHTGGAFQE